MVVRSRVEIRRVWRSAPLAFLVGLMVSVPLARGLDSRADEKPVTAEERQQAQTYLRNKDWKHAAQAFASIVEREPKNGQAWFALGNVRHSAGEYPLAIEAFKHAVDINHNPVAMYDLACAYALTKDKEKALEWLGKAVSGGFDQSQQLKTDADLASLRDDPRFKAIEVQAVVQEKPCSQSPESRQFDFWIGEWDVHDTSGRLVGKSSIQLILGDCVIYENWTAGNHGGKSFNAYNKDDGKWIQTWVDDQGDVTQFVNGEFKEHTLRFDAKKKAPDGKPIDKHLTFFDLGDGRVRQFAEQSTDGGKTWSTEYDFLYVRKA